MAEQAVFSDDLVTAKDENGRTKFGVVRQVGGMEDSDNSSDSDSDDESSAPLERGFVRVSWYNGVWKDVERESQLEVVDRSCLPRDVVRTKDGKQLGTAISTKVTCDLTLPGTSKTLKSIDVSDLVAIEPFGELDFVAYGSWLGRVVLPLESLVLRFSQGARGKLSTDIAESDDLLLDAYPPESFDTVDSFLYYPGQLLIGPGKAFKDIQWISGEPITFRPKSPYKVLVEQIELNGVKMEWAIHDDKEEKDIDGSIDESDHEGLSAKKTNSGSSVDPEPQEKTERENPAEPPSEVLRNEELKKLRRLDHFWQGHVWVGDRFRYQLSEEKAANLNRQADKSNRKRRRRKVAKRMEAKLHQSTSVGSLELSRARKRKNIKNKSESSNQPADLVEDDEGEDDDGDAEYDGNEGGPSSSAGFDESTLKDCDDEIEVLVNNESDLSIMSPVGQTPAIRGTLSCRVGKFELDFAFMQEDFGGWKRKKFQCNIQNPECSREMMEKIGMEFQCFMKSVLKKKMHLLDAASCDTVMAQCPVAIRTFVSKQSSLGDQDIFFEYTTNGKHASGIVDKDGNKTEIEYQGDDQNLLGMLQSAGTQSHAQDNAAQTNDFTLTTAPPGRKQAGPNVTFHSGQWITVEVTRTYTKVDIQWQNGSIEKDVETRKLLPAHHVDDNDFCPGDFVTDKRSSGQVDRYGVVLKVDSQNRMTKIQWFENRRLVEMEEVSSYEIADHEELQFRISDIILRNKTKHLSESEIELGLTDEQIIGELLRVTETGMLKVLWSNGTTSLVHPLDVQNGGNEDENLLFGDTDDEASWVTASSADASSNESELIGDAEHPESVEERIDSLDLNYERGEGSCPHGGGGEGEGARSDQGVHADGEEHENAEGERTREYGEARDAAHEDEIMESEMAGEKVHADSEEHENARGESAREYGEAHEDEITESEMAGEKVHADSEERENAQGESAREYGGAHEDEITESEMAGENVRNEILELAFEITYSICDRAMNEIREHEQQAHENDSRNHNDEGQKADVDITAENLNDGTSREQRNAIPVDDEAPGASAADSSLNNHRQNFGELDDAEDKDDVTATISSESILSADDTPINCSGAHSSFSIASSVPSGHHFVSRHYDDASPKSFVKAVQRDLKLLRTSLPPGIIVKTFEDRMDLLSVLISGPTRTPYEDGVFSFDVYLPSRYPDTPPSVHYISFSPRLNPNLYETGRVCVSLLGTWSGKGTERWTKDSTVLQVLLSIQGLILNSEPYYNEAGYEGHRGTAEGMQNSRCYNEMVMLRLVQHMTSLIQNPPEAFVDEVKEFCSDHVPALLTRVRSLLNQGEAQEDEAAGSAVDKPQGGDAGFPLLPLSKGVVLSLQCRLCELETAAKTAGYL